MSEFNVQYRSYLFTILSAALIFIIVSVLLSSLFVPDSILNVFLSLSFGLALCYYLQSNFLNGSMMRLDGTRQTWDSKTLTGNLIVWILIIALILVILLLSKGKSTKIIQYLGIYLVLIQVAASTYSMITAKWDENTSYILKTDDLLELDSKENVIVFILDWYDEQILETIASENPDFLSPLQDFTWYQNQTSKYAFTDMSIPYLLTNVEWKKGMSKREYVEYAFKNSGFLTDVAQQRYDIDIYTDSFLLYDSDHVIRNLQHADESQSKCDYLKTIDFMTRCAKYQATPFFFKHNYWYETDLLYSLAVTEISFDDDNIDFYQSLTKEKLYTRNEDSTKQGLFKFYHLHGVHDPKFTEDITYDSTPDIFAAGRGVMKIVYEYIAQLKSLGIYDSSTIIITADHGENYFDRPDALIPLQLNLTSNPILLVKKKEEHHNLTTSTAPVSHSEFFATIIESMGGDSKKYGDSYDDVPENKDRIRDMVYYRTGDIPYTKYAIHGSATDINSWSIIESD